MTERAFSSRREDGVAVLAPSTATGPAPELAVRSFREAVDELLADDGCRALVLELAVDLDWGLVDAEPAALVSHAREVQAACESLWSGGKPTIAAVGARLGGVGFDLAMSCHAIYAGETAGLAPFARLRLDGFGGLSRLQRRVGPVRAAWLALEGRLIAARELLALGLAERVVPDGTCLAEACAWARACAAREPALSESLLEGLTAGAELPLDDALELEAQLAGLAAARNRRS